MFFNTKEKQILDLINEDTFIISDTHFNHENVLTFEPGRQSAMMIDGYTDHNEWIIDNWNSVVGPEDVVLHLGDFAFKGIQELNGRLNGKKILILGNHDRKGAHTYNDFDMVIRGLWVEAGINQKHYLHSNMTDELSSILIKEIMGEKVLFCHYPVCESELRYAEGRPHNPMGERLLLAKDLYYEYGCTVNVHGHTHSNCMIDRDVRKYKNVSMENIGMKPKKIKEILKGKKNVN